MPDTTLEPTPEPRGAPTDLVDDTPWVMQLVVRVERADPPSRTAACAAAATAVVALLADERAQPDGPWEPAVRRWTDLAIRKHCRRARGVAWDRAAHLPGVTVEVDGAQVRAFVPTPTDAIPRELAKLQLSGSEPDDPGRAERVDVLLDGPVVVSICPEPPLPFGKAAAAAGHAAQVAAAQMDAGRYRRWRDAGFPVVVEHPGTERWASLLGTSPVRIVDAGFTVVPTGTTTALAR
ncbi:peptidyl-tRNA hydrolase [Cellulomonas dongxiuzhuiae]|uniref:peptidyl-tRNA hydrolase n=1 Tax=Cellulomonas dongxiuzhuiae TaxID=2819979 RepID=UPI001AAE98C5|nr:peptidyl-tRNA hydrolase [Cellulomonas dongxiuzhuiae]MBO3088257.1 peptidyl-tRNA hydrolase [Cellulomonas dongxiuzhuiae]